MNRLTTAVPITWCPGCGNFEILSSVKAVLEDLHKEGVPFEKIILVGGIGNHAKIVDYLHINSFSALHGRAIPAAEAIKLAEPDTKVICFAGDGDTYAEGLEHLIFAAKRNIDITVVIHNNRTYALATGQFTPTSQKSFKGSTMPYGAKEDPFNPLELMLVSGATYIARGYPVRSQHFRKLLREAIGHKGFSLIDVLQVCVTYNNLYSMYNKYAEEYEASDPASFDAALKVIRSWNYDAAERPIAIGKFFEVERPGYEENYSRFKAEKEDRNEMLKNVLERFF